MTTHVRQVILALTAVLALAVVCAVAWSPRPEAAARPADEPVRAVVPRPAVDHAPDAASSPAADVRNVFEFADRAETAPAPMPLPPVVIPLPLDPPPALQPSIAPIRLVGFVRRGGTLRAALSLTGNVAVLAPGEEADGYSVLAVDEDAGVTVRSPDGAELVLPPPQP
jgi:hypothetical protein